MLKCIHCGRVPQFSDHRECNFCWELRHRIDQNPILARKILDKIIASLSGEACKTLTDVQQDYLNGEVTLNQYINKEE